MPKTKKASPLPGWRAHDFPQKFPVTGKQVGWVEPILHDAVCCWCKKEIRCYDNGSCWTRVLFTNAIACNVACATYQFYKDRGTDALYEIFIDLLGIATPPDPESVKFAADSAAAIK